MKHYTLEDTFISWSKQLAAIVKKKNHSDCHESLIGFHISYYGYELVTSGTYTHKNVSATLINGTQNSIMYCGLRDDMIDSDLLYNILRSS